MSENKSCEQRIDEELARMMADIRTRNEAEDRDEWESENGDPLEAIGIQREVVITLTLSWGGPADYLEVHIDPDDRDITEIVYIFQDWFDGARRKVTGEDFDLLASELEWLLYTE